MRKKIVLTVSLILLAAIGMEVYRVHTVHYSKSPSRRFVDAASCLQKGSADILNWQALRSEADVAFCVPITLSAYSSKEELERFLLANGLLWAYQPNDDGITLSCHKSRRGPCTAAISLWNLYFIMRPYGFVVDMARRNDRLVFRGVGWLIL